MAAAELALHYETSVELDAPMAKFFSHLDDFHKLSAHMEQSSGMMMGSKMRIETDARQGRAAGSVIRMDGKMLGMRLSLEEVVTERTPPTRKVWRTLHTDLVVIGAYELGFELRENGPATLLRVFINYNLPKTGIGRWIGPLFGKTYAQWCTEKMAADAVTQFRQGSVT